jgi:hypothetical protein
MFKLYAAENLQAAYLIQQQLTQAGIPCQILNEYAQGGVGELSFTQAYPEIWLDDTRHIEQARQIIARFEQGDKNVANRPCPHCHEPNPATFEVCWRCQTPLEEDSDDKPRATHHTGEK